MAVTVWRWPCGGHMTCHVTWQDNPLRVTGIKKKGKYYTFIRYYCHGASCLQANDAEGRKTIDWGRKEGERERRV